MLGEVVVAAVGDALELVPAPREEELHVGGARGVVAELVGSWARRRSWSCGMPRLTYQASRSAHQYSYQRGDSSGGTKNSISICSNSRVRNTKLPGVISLRNDLPTWAMPNGGRLRLVSSTFLKLTNMPCAVSGPQVDLGAGALDGPGEGLEHEVELAGLGEGARLAAARARVRVLELVEAVPLLAVAAVDERVGEVGQVARGLPDGGRPEDGGVEADDVVAQLHHRAPPLVLHVAQQQHAERAVVVGRPEAAVDLRRREHEPAPLAQVHDLVEQLGIRRRA